MNKKTILISVITFIIFFGVSCGVTFFVMKKPSKKEPAQVEVAQNDSSSVKKDTPEAKAPVETVAEVQKPEVKEEPKAEPKPVDTEKLKRDCVRELNSIISSRSSNYPRNISIHVSGNQSNEQATSISMIYQYLKTGIWTSATVTNVDLNAKGKVSGIYVRVTHGAGGTASDDEE